MPVKIIKKRIRIDNICLSELSSIDLSDNTKINIDNDIIWVTLPNFSFNFEFNPQK